MLKFLKSHLIMTFLVYGGAIAMLLGAIWYAYQYVDPLPPSKITIAAGSSTGAYTKYAREYAEFFAKEGVELVIVESNGSMDNLARMSDPEGGVDAAFMQGGITTPEEHPDMRSLGSLYYEPLWVFFNKKVKLGNLTELKNKKVAIGAEGSGTNYVISKILHENGIDPTNSKLQPIGSGQAIPDLIKGKLDALFLIAGVDSKSVDALAAADDVKLLSFSRAEAYARSHHYLKRLVLPQGALSLAKNLPSQDIDMLAPTANLVVKEDLHPAIKYLFLLAANKTHLQGDVFAQPGQFPNGDAILFPLSKEAESFYKNGPPLLMRYLPYQLAITLERLKILLIPLLTLLYPLFKFTPPAYRWQIRRRIFKWYKHLKGLDKEAYDITTKTDAEAMLEQLLQLDHDVMETSVPLSYTDYIYSLRIHISMIQARLEKSLAKGELS